MPSIVFIALHILSNNKDGEVCLHSFILQLLLILPVHTYSLNNHALREYKIT